MLQYGVDNGGEKYVLMLRLAHVKWFVDDQGTTVDPLGNDEWSIVLLGIITLAVLFWVIGKSRYYRVLDRRINRRLHTYSTLVFPIVRFSTGLLLIINAAKGLLYAPNVTTSDVHNGVFLSALLFLAGTLLLIGIRIRLAAQLILFVYILSIITIQPFDDVLDHIEYIGIGLYLLLHDNSRYAAMLRAKNLVALASPTALLRIFIGLGLMTLALSEKLIGISNSTHFLAVHNWNFLSFLEVSDRSFIILAGITEFVVGLTLVLNIVPKLTTAVVVVLMTITAAILGIDEVFGHLFALSLVAIVWLKPEVSGRSLPAAAHTALTSKTSAPIRKKTATASARKKPAVR